VVGKPVPKQTRAGFHYDNEVPNFPEVSGTSFPVLATVLAGFAVTITVQILLLPGSTGDLSWQVTVGLAAFLLSTLALLLATIFAINAQARNYLPFLELGDAGRHLLNVDDVTTWITRIERQWYIYHWAALCAFYSGIGLVLAGINLIIWEYAGAGLAIVFLIAILVSMSATLVVAAIAGAEHAR
jgi:hypothetical protein